MDPHLLTKESLHSDKDIDKQLLDEVRKKRIASTCCICRRSLTDPESIERGIGPVCAKRFLGINVPTSFDVSDFAPIQSLMCECLSMEITNKALSKIKIEEWTTENNEVVSRRGSKLWIRSVLAPILYAGSALVGQQDEKEKMIDFCFLVCRLGYSELAFRIFESTYKINLKKKKGFIIYVGDYDPIIDAVVKQIYRGERDPKNKCWIFTGDSLILMENLFQHIKGNTAQEWLTCHIQTINIPEPEEREFKIPKGVEMLDRKNGSILIQAYNANKSFRTALKTVKGKWNLRSKGWIVAGNRRHELQNILMECFPVEDNRPDRLDELELK